MRRSEMPDGLTRTQYRAWDWLPALDDRPSAEESPFRMATWKAMEKKGWVKLVPTPEGTRIHPL